MNMADHLCFEDLKTSETIGKKWQDGEMGILDPLTK